MRKPLHVMPEPCSTCPYRKDVPSGIWHAEEYKKLIQYDNNEAFGVFLCHQSPIIGCETVCRGWLSVHCESVAARLAVAQGVIRDEDRYAEVKAELYGTGAEAAKAGMKAIKRPSREARRQSLRLLKTGRFRTK